MPVAAPGRQDKRSVGAGAVEDVDERCGDGIPMLVGTTVGKAEEDGSPAETEGLRGGVQFSAPHQRERRGRVRGRVGVRPLAIGRDEEVDRDAACGGRGEHSRSAERLVVGVRRDDDDPVDVEVERREVARQTGAPDGFVGARVTVVEAHHAPPPFAMSPPILARSRSA
ncbi:hypothetical protein QE392_001231 [Microbacterium proteolyticum]|nr:hypothetical protein [Microbacterium proteolyticum]